ncbi:hypothetical protein [Algoriphagus zhangzhouensis]|uniref:Collagen triple helix repeat-containing protein n=1 Tax=Algoriphagus zhangzhouensis TaxID=1073327 RepID=A0A1M7ZF61_9BACT|nr:hypothetical protein [Algoriphagus zhangzhouensis]TDY46196.1 hypothetical protein A8938_2807 [Algoriphagus zhangzhouensis]SHO63514.1 hypothetical protein SAMN04488108_2804 [Algoriphagus zhangzhouensis]
MKRFTTIFSLIAVMAFQACEGPVGPQGPAGQDGVDGITIVGEAFEVEVDFTETNDYTEIFEFDPEIYDSDVVLIYIQWEQDNGTPIWRPLPQTIFFQEGVLMYNYDFTQYDFSVFLDGPLDYSLLGDEWTQDQLFRVVIVPADFSTTNRIDYSDYDAVTKMLGIEEDDFVRLSPKSKQ